MAAALVGAEVMVAQYHAGGEVDSFCTRCRMVLAHTILAVDGSRPARVQCNTCQGQHNYRPATPEPRSSSSSGSSSPRAAAATSPSRTRLSFDEIFATKHGPTKTYSPKVTFAVDDTVSHPTFGSGYVIAVRQDKVDITFRIGTKTLMHARA